jgi:hypothetical protein
MKTVVSQTAYSSGLRQPHRSEALFCSNTLIGETETSLSVIQRLIYPRRLLHSNTGQGDDVQFGFGSHRKPVLLAQQCEALHVAFTLAALVTQFRPRLTD